MVQGYLLLSFARFLPISCISVLVICFSLCSRKPTGVSQPFARFVRQKRICHWSQGRPVCVEHFQQLHYLYRSQSLITNISSPLPIVSCAPMTIFSIVLSASSQIVQSYFLLSDLLPFIRFVGQTNLSLTSRATSMCWTFPAIVFAFIVLYVLSQIVQGYFPLSVVLPWHIAPHFSHCLITIVQGYFLLSHLLPFARFLRQKPICHRPWVPQYALNIPSNRIILYRSQGLITNCSRLLSTVSGAPMTVIFIVFSVSSQIAQGYFPLSDLLLFPGFVRHKPICHWPLGRQ